MEKQILGNAQDVRGFWGADVQDNTKFGRAEILLLMEETRELSTDCN